MFCDNLQHESHKPYGPLTSIHDCSHYIYRNIGTSTAQTAETHWHMHWRFCTLSGLVPTPLVAKVTCTWSSRLCGFTTPISKQLAQHMYTARLVMKVNTAITQRWLISLILQLLYPQYPPDRTGGSGTGQNKISLLWRAVNPGHPAIASHFIDWATMDEI